MQYHRCSHCYAQDSLCFRSVDALTHTPIQHPRPGTILTTHLIIIRTTRGTVTTAERTTTEIESPIAFPFP